MAEDRIQRRLDLNTNYEIKIWEEDFRQVPTRMLLARICQPVGDGPFPALLDLHGGAWAGKDRFANVAMAEAIARSGILTVSVDLRLSGEAPYPASVQDANYGIRWLKMKAPGWKGDPSTIGVLGSSSGGHVAQLLGMCPHRIRATMRCRWKGTRRFVNGGAKRDHLGGVRRDRLAAAGLSP